jgi:hypothetical protein
VCARARLWRSDRLPHAARGAAPPHPAPQQGRGNAAETALVARARAIHDRGITLDTHNDINASNFEYSRNYTLDLGNRVNLPKMKQGGLDVSFFFDLPAGPA